MRPSSSARFIGLLFGLSFVIALAYASPEVDRRRSNDADDSNEEENTVDETDGNIKPQSDRVTQVAKDKQNRVSNTSDIRFQLQPGFTDEYLHGFHKIIDDLFAKVLNVPASNKLGTRSEFAHYALTDRSNDALAKATTQEIIEQAGFKYESHYVEARDGYITQLVHLINPLADRSQLKQPPVVMFHGGTADTSMYIMSSSLQHHPEKWPRDPIEDEPMTSWNRSLAFVLANHGYDVWLVGTRGCNRANQGHKTVKKDWSMFPGPSFGKSRDDWSDLNVKEAIKYWSNMTLDDIIHKELPVQIGRIMQLTRSSKVSIIALSMSTPLTLGLMASRPELAKRVHNYVALGPLLSEENSGNAMKLFYRTLCTRLTDAEGALFFPEFLFSQPLRDIMFALEESRTLRYTLVKTILNLLFGPSPKFNAILELNTINHIGLPVGYRTLKHMCQILVSKKLQRFDHGGIKNTLKYGSIQPPEYDLGKVNPANWMLVSAEHDPFSNLNDVKRLFKQVKRKPYRHIFLTNSNHLDLVSLVDIDTKVNLPILEFMDRFPSKDHSQEGQNMQLNQRDLLSEQLEPFVPVDNRNPDQNVHILDQHRRRSIDKPPTGMQKT